ncbi:hypothetical protein [Caballeronia sp. ATUFL_M1_KS5A]|uniref:hypothetical protein n=1 Tax=Caballeronia sp. ATUFL_M1_KS5A TaxID=2921778 RepID=UPI002027FC99|nr:hypothetical protein [Caballeronia sp. ATUFL_M1_KS5A]
MSQTRGPNAGYRGKPSSRREPPHHLTNPKRPPRGQPPSKETNGGATPASIIKTRSLKFLVDTVGAENIALGLDSSMTRMAELMRGERFTPETAFHMETTLGLPSGFFDQLHPVLSPETIARLKAPLEFVHADETVNEGGIEQAPLLPSAQEPSLLVSSLSKDTTMPSKSSKEASGATKTRAQKASAQASGQAARAAESSKPHQSHQAAGRKQARPNGGVTVERIRQANLHVLTTRNGSKVKLGAVLGLSGSNMAHRLHGKKRMDDAEAERFTAGLGLPAGWLDAPRGEADIPESVAQLLAPTSRVRAPGQAPAPTAVAASEDTEVAAAPTSEIERALPIASSNAHIEPLPADAAGDGDHVASPHHENVSSAVATRLDGPVQRIESHTPAAVSAPVLSQPAVAISPPTDTAPSSTVGTTLDGLDGIAPIAEALLKTLAGKARTGRLDELKALELLRQAVLL